MLLALILAAGSAHPLALPRGCRDRSCVRGRNIVAAGSAVVPPAFEFAPVNGAGMGTVCACTTPTGSKGEAMTFTRASSATCLKGNLTTGIANGDMVTCTSGQPRVMSGGVGVLGLEIEGPRTNDMLWSNDITNAAWPSEGGGNDCTKTADAAAGPNGTTTADRVQCIATTTGVYQAINQIAVTHNPASVSTFLRGNGTSGTIDVCTSSGSYSCSPCTFVSTSWTRCLRENQNVAGGRIYFGNMTALNGGIARGAADFFIAQSQSEAGGFASMPIDTTTVAVTRAADYATLPFVLGSTSGSLSATVIPETAASPAWGGDTDHALISLSAVGPAFQELFDARAASQQLTLYGVAGASTNTTWGFAGLAENAVAAFWTGGGAIVTTIAPGGNVTAGTTTTGASTFVELGATNATPSLYGIIKKVCADPSSTRCR